MTTETNTPAARKLLKELKAAGASDSNAAVKAIKAAPGNKRKVSEATKEVAATNAALKAKGGTSNRPISSVVAKPAATKDKAPTKAKAGNTFTTVDLAEEHGINAKTLRARIRRNIDKWEPLFADGERHVYKDNATTRKAVAALLDA